MLMSALGGASGGNSMSSGLGSLMNPYQDGSAGGEADDTPDGQQAERTRQLEREVSSLTNQNLKLQEQNADLQQKLQDQISLQEPDLLENNKKMISEEIATKVCE